MKMIALKIDVDTLRGTMEGVPQLQSLLLKHRAGATFLFSLGPDHTGRAIKRVFRKGFLGKVQRTSVLEHYGLKTLLYGTLLPGPDIGTRAAEPMRAVAAAGFEVGIHTWDHVAWQDRVAHAPADWTERQMSLAESRFQAIFGRPARIHGAAGWQMNDAAFRHLDQAGMQWASDTRGTGPFVPVIAGHACRCPQLPTTLPTLDELIGLDGLDASNVARHLLRQTENPPQHGHVFTLHAELEGMRLSPVLDALLSGWLQQGYQLVSLGDLGHALEPGRLPRCPVVMGTIPGRSGTLAVQGAPLPESQFSTQ
ncbi:MAG: 4-deoxy-4-formamido-L-arabinose-phosphoundecaprenol deformylase [Betaproteobacteria bacterium]|nr:4-deoxy-4-formamido-L-arabinose-phosphoundecaprenol deformylase [Betaproteobacteria bacterium]